MARKARRRDRRKPEPIEEKEPEVTFADYVKAALAENRPDDHPVYRHMLRRKDQHA
jgi:hypothetical protein